MGARGLLIAAVFAAAMSTVSTSLNSSATLVMSDFYKRLLRPESSDTEHVRVLRASTIAWGAMGTVMALALVRLTESALDIWWMLSGVLGAAIIGLFLLGIIVPKIRGGAAILVLVNGMLLIAWMAASKTDYWPSQWSNLVSPFHPLLVIVIGPTAMVLLGWIVAKARSYMPKEAIGD